MAADDVFSSKMDRPPKVRARSIKVGSTMLIGLLPTLLVKMQCAIRALRTLRMNTPPPELFLCGR